MKNFNPLRSRLCGSCTISNGKFFGDMVGFFFDWADDGGSDTSHMPRIHGSVLRRMHIRKFMRSGSDASAFTACILRIYAPFGQH